MGHVMISSQWRKILMWLEWPFSWTRWVSCSKSSQLSKMTSLMTSTPFSNRTRIKSSMLKTSKIFSWSSAAREISKMRFQTIFRIKSGWHQVSMIKIQDYSLLEKESMLLYNSTLVSSRLTDFNRRKHWRTINIRKKEINQNTTQKLAKSQLN